MNVAALAGVRSGGAAASALLRLLLPAGRALYSVIFVMVGIPEAMLLKNLSMLGGALLVAHFGAGQFSLGSRLAKEDSL